MNNGITNTAATSNNNNNNNNTNDMANGRNSASPARTIDSHDSTTGSMDTIVDRSLNREQLLQVESIEQSTNLNNVQNVGGGDSLTNSQIGILHRQQQQTDGSSQQEQQQQQQQQLQKQNLDAQNHIYASPVYDEKPAATPLKLTATTLMEDIKQQHPGNGITITGNDDDLKKLKLISHTEFKQQLEVAMATRANAASAAAGNNKSNANTIDSRISKKQRCPPEYIKYKGSGGAGGGSINDADGSITMQRQQQQHRRRRDKPSSACCSAFPLQIVLGTLQLLLAITLVTLGALLIVREAALSMAGCGIWSGLIAAVTGALGVVSIRKTQTAFLALSLVCIASSTLALAISGVGLTRDLNRIAEEKELTMVMLEESTPTQLELMNANNEISAACGLIFALFLHFVISIVSVYRCALQICTSSQHNELRSVVVKSNMNGAPLDQHKVEQYIKAMSLNSNEKENPEKLAAMLMYATHMGSSLPPSSIRKLTPPNRPIMLIPASAAGSGLLAPPPPPPTRLPPAPPGGSMLLPVPPPQYRATSVNGLTLPYMHPTAGVVYAHAGSLAGTYRTHKSTKSAEMNGQRRRRRAAHILRGGKMDANRRQRRKSEADIIDGGGVTPNFQYTGLDRAIADSFLERQEQSQAGSHIDYSSSSTSTSSSAPSETYGQQSRTSSKTKIVCRDVVM